MITEIELTRAALGLNYARLMVLASHVSKRHDIWSVSQMTEIEQRALLKVLLEMLSAKLKLRAKPHLVTLAG